MISYTKYSLTVDNYYRPEFEDLADRYSDAPRLQVTLTNHYLSDRDCQTILDTITKALLVAGDDVKIETRVEAKQALTKAEAAANAEAEAAAAALQEQEEASV